MVVAEAAAVKMSGEDIGSFKNKAVYRASGAPKYVDKRRRYRWMDRRTNGWMDGQTFFYRGASEHLKSVSEIKAPREVRFVALLLKMHLDIPLPLPLSCSLLRAKIKHLTIVISGSPIVL